MCKGFLLNEVTEFEPATFLSRTQTGVFYEDLSSKTSINLGEYRAIIRTSVSIWSNQDEHGRKLN